MNVELLKEAEYFGDIVIVPYMDNYDLVVLKTVAICEYGVSHLCYFKISDSLPLSHVVLYHSCLWLLGTYCGS